METKKIIISQISNTQWNCRARNCTSIKHNFKAIINVLDEIVNSNNLDVTQAIGKVICFLGKCFLNKLLNYVFITKYNVKMYYF